MGVSDVAFQNPARGFAWGDLDSAQASPQPSSLPPQRVRRAPRIQGQARYRLPNLDGGNPVLLLSITVLIKCLYSFDASYRLGRCRDMSLPISIASSRISTSIPIFWLRPTEGSRACLKNSTLSISSCLDDSKVLSKYSPARDPIDLLEP